MINTVIATVAVESNPSGVTFDGTNIWVSNFQSSTVSKIIRRPKTRHWHHPCRLAPERRGVRRHQHLGHQQLRQFGVENQTLTAIDTLSNGAGTLPCFVRLEDAVRFHANRIRWSRTSPKSVKIRGRRAACFADRQEIVIVGGEIDSPDGPTSARASVLVLLLGHAATVRSG